MWIKKTSHDASDGRYHAVFVFKYCIRRVRAATQTCSGILCLRVLFRLFTCDWTLAAKCIHLRYAVSDTKIKHSQTNSLNAIWWYLSCTLAKDLIFLSQNSLKHSSNDHIKSDRLTQQRGLLFVVKDKKDLLKTKCLQMMK